MADNLYPYFARAGAAAGPLLATKEVSADLHILKVTSVDQTGAAGSVGQGSTTAGQSGVLSMGAVTSAVPSYTTAQTNPISLTTAGLLRVLSSMVASTLQAGADGITNTSRAQFIDGTGGTSNAYLPIFGWAYNGSTWDRIRLAVANGGLQVEEGPFTVTRATGDLQIKGSAGFVHTVSVAATTATPTAGLLTIYDSTTEAGTAIYSEWIFATDVGHTILLDARVANGIFVGYDATLANVSVAVSFR